MKKLLIAGLLTMAVMILTARAQNGGTVLVLSSGSPEYKAVAAGFGKTFSGDFREINLNGSDIEQKKVGEALKAEKPGLVVVVGDLAAQMAKWYLKDVPIIYCDSIRATKISLASGKTIGIYHEPDPVEQLQIIKKLFPGKKRVGLLYCPEFSRINEAKIKSKSQGVGITLEVAAMNSVKDVPGRLKALIPKVDLLWVLTDPVVLSSHSNQFIVLQSVPAKLPIFCGDNLLAHRGATAALVPDLEDVGVKAAGQAKLVLRGSAPSKGATIYPKGKLVLNKKMASMFNISFPASLVEQAAEVIQ